MDIDAQVALLMQGTEYGDENLQRTMASELRERLIDAQAAGRKLKVYCGFDPRKPDLHIGHTVPMRKLRQFQDLGHEVMFVVGTFTSLIGDPSDQDKLRSILSPQQAQENARTYAEQAFRILDREKTKIRYNNEWLSKLSFADLIQLASNFTIQQFLTRDAFRQRWDQGDPIYLHETFYSMMQGYDAYALQADVQIGGTDQLFNIVTAARKLMVALGARPNIAIILGILPGTDGMVKMSKSLGNHIPISTGAADMYGKVMSIPDAAMPAYCRLVTRWTPDEIAHFESRIRTGDLHPRDAKMSLAYEITAALYDSLTAQNAQQEFISVFQKHAVPEEVPGYTCLPGQTVLDILIACGAVASRNEGRRLIEQNGVRFDGRHVTDSGQVVTHPGVLQAGKRKFYRLIL